MKKRILPIIFSLAVLFAIIFVIAPSSLTEPVFELPAPKEDVTVVAVGDSLTKGEGDPERRGYVGYVQDHLKKKRPIGEVTVYNYGITGDTTDDLLEKLQSQDVLNHIEDANLILFTIGGNDIMEVVENNFLSLTIDLFQKKRAHYQKNLEQILTILRHHNDKAQMICIGVFNPFFAYFPKVQETGQIIGNWNETGRKVTAQFNNTTFVRISDLFQNRTEQLISSDHFHPNPQGYNLIGERVMEQVHIVEEPSE